MRFVLFLVFFISGVFAFNVNISQSTVSNGKSVLLEFEKEANVEYKDILISKKRYKIFQNPVDSSKMYTIIPISYYQKPGTQKLEIEYKNENVDEYKTLYIKIEEGNIKKSRSMLVSQK